MPSHFFDSFFGCKSIKKQTISRTDELLSMYDSTPLKNKWGTDLDEPIPEDKIIQGIFPSSICLRHAVIQIKIVQHLHWTKVRLSKIKADIDPTCN